MHTRTFSVVAATLAALTAASALAVPSTDPMFEDRPRMGAKVAKTKAKMNAVPDQGGASRWGDEQGGAAGDEERCGNVDIGNVNTGGRRNAPREVIVVVQGDVINTNNRCK